MIRSNVFPLVIEGAIASHFILASDICLSVSSVDLYPDFQVYVCVCVCVCVCVYVCVCVCVCVCVYVYVLPSTSPWIVSEL